MATPVQEVTIKAKFPLYKKEELAERVELITLEKTGFELVAHLSIMDTAKAQTEWKEPVSEKEYTQLTK